jgi:uncharacterized RDD family membrane protein YckC
MSEPVTQPTADQETAKRTLGSRLLAWSGALLLVVVVVVLLVHVIAPALGPADEAPPGHPQSACIACHIVTGDAGTE